MVQPNGVVSIIDELIRDRSLLKHPFYRRWTAGTLSADELRDYTGQYYAFESTFPRLLSALHTRSDRPDVRQSLLDNLWDEEHGEVNHAEMWLRFGEGLRLNREDILRALQSAKARARKAGQTVGPNTIIPPAPGGTKGARTPGGGKHKGLAKVADMLNPGSASSLPVPLLVLGALALLLVVAGGAGLIVKRVQARRSGP